tara:strand:- start:1529 stop:2125 length:597 start_codon:yes stop_codon:yes gene_type:complete
MEQTFNYPDVFTTSEDTTKIVGALLIFNKEMGVVGKTSKNPFFKSNYADLPTILKATKEPLEKAGLSITHFPVGDNRLITRLSHSSGQFYQSMNYMKSVKDDPQARGSVITYMMRYAVGAVLGLSIDKDDDANSSTRPQAPILKTMTENIKDAMLKYIEEGTFDSVERQLPKYSPNANKTVVLKALSDAIAVKTLAKI